VEVSDTNAGVRRKMVSVSQTTFKEATDEMKKKKSDGDGQGGTGNGKRNAVGEEKRSSPIVLGSLPFDTALPTSSLASTSIVVMESATLGEKCLSKLDLLREKGIRSALRRSV
jgi:hypothetical protein